MSASTLPNDQIEILLVEDSAAEVELLRLGFREAPFRLRLNVARDGVEAMEFLRRGGEHADAPRPDLVLLDLNLPRKDGCEVLSEIKTDQKLRKIPVIILATSRAEEDIARAYDLYANTYLTKPIGFDGFAFLVRSISDYWFSLAKLPSG